MAQNFLIFSVFSFREIVTTFGKATDRDVRYSQATAIFAFTVLHHCIVSKLWDSLRIQDEEIC